MLNPKVLNKCYFTINLYISSRTKIIKRFIFEIIIAKYGFYSDFSLKNTIFALIYIIALQKYIIKLVAAKCFFYFYT